MNKKLLFAPLMVFAAGVLAACSTSTVVARPTWKDGKIIDANDLKDNQMKAIYDAVKALGDTNANVLNEILYKITENKIGKYEELVALVGEGSKATDDDFKAFIKKYNYYVTKETKLVKKGGTTVAIDDAKSFEISKNMIKAQYNRIQEDVAEKLYDDIKGGTYSIDNEFYESKYIKNLRKNMYELPSYEDIIKTVTLNEKVILLPRAFDTSTGEKVTWKTYIRNFLNLDKKVKYNDKEIGIYDDYIKSKIIPDLYRTYLIQTYVQEQRYSNISRSYARKVNMITIANGGELYKDKTLSLMTEFAKTYITDAQIAAGTKYNFDILETAMRGLVNENDSKTDIDEKANALLNAAGFEKIKEDKTTGAKDLKWYYCADEKGEGKPGAKRWSYVYKGTKLGDLVEKLQKVYDLENDDQSGGFKKTLKKTADATAYNDLTNSGAYTIDEGLAIKERDIMLTTYSKQGWYLKNGGLSDLNSDIRERLFNIQTSTLIDGNQKYESGDYVKYFNSGKAFLTGKNVSSSSDENLIVLRDGSNYHIIEVEEAISTAKMSDSSNDRSYMYLKATDDEYASFNKLSEIAYNVIKTASTGDTYKKSANQYYLMISNILFYDQSVYDYFKSQYPDLFK